MAGDLRGALVLPEALPTPAERQALRARIAEEMPGADRRRLLPCARCGAPMERKLATVYGPVWIDVCAPHGVWFDGGEFERYAAFAEAGGLSLPPPPRVKRPPPRLADEPPRHGLRSRDYLLDAIFRRQHRR